MFMQSALDMKAKVASDAMVPIASVFMLDINSQLDHKTMTSVRSLDVHNMYIMYAHVVIFLCRQDLKKKMGLQ